MSLFFKQLEVGPMANYVYLLGDTVTKECAIVDPAWDVPQILKVIAEQGYKAVAAFITHNHFDHVNGVAPLLKAVDLPIYVNQRDATELGFAGTNLKPVSGGDSTRIGSVDITFLHTPGHTEGSQCLRLGDRLVTGDTLFIDGCGRVDLPTSDPEKMYVSLRKIAELPRETVVWPGHNYAEETNAPLSRQLQSNPYLKLSATRGLTDFLQLVGR